MTVSVGQRRALLVVLTGSLSAVRCQRFLIPPEPIPPFSLRSLFTVYVYSYEDAPEKILAPFVSLDTLRYGSWETSSNDEGMGVRGRPTAAAAEASAVPSGYKGLQLSLVPEADLWKVLRVTHFCSDALDVAHGLAFEEGRLLMQEVPQSAQVVSLNVSQFSPLLGAQAPLPSTGAFRVLLSNCGQWADPRPGGRVRVHQAYGYLPGRCYFLMPLLGHLLLAYVALAAVWGLVLARDRAAVAAPRAFLGTGAVIALSVLDTALAFSCHNDYNYHGRVPWIQRELSALASALRPPYCFSLLLAVVLGWDVTRPVLDEATLGKIKGLLLLHVLCGFARNRLVFCYHVEEAALWLATAASVATGLLNSVFLCWIAKSLWHQIQTLKDRQQHGKLALFRLLRAVAAVAAAAATLALFAEQLDLRSADTQAWQLEWVWTDAVFQAILFASTATALAPWACGMMGRWLEEDGKSPGVAGSAAVVT